MTTNWSSSRSEASRFGGRAVSLDDLPAALRHADILVTAVSAPEPVVRRAAVEPAIEARRGPRLVIDLGVPRNVEVDIGRLEQVFLLRVQMILLRVQVFLICEQVIPLHDQIIPLYDQVVPLRNQVIFVQFGNAVFYNIFG